MDTRVIGRLVSMMEDSTLTKLEVTEGDLHVKLEKQKEIREVPQYISAPMMAPAAMPMAQAPAAGTAPAAAAAPAAEEEAVPADAPKGDQTQWDDYKEITSPLVGAFHGLSASDGEDIEVGDTVKKGQVVCVIEAMKLMNEIESEYSGEVVQVLVKDGDIVEFGQVLYRIKE